MIVKITRNDGSVEHKTLQEGERISALGIDRGRFVVYINGVLTTRDAELRDGDEIEVATKAKEGN